MSRPYRPSTHLPQKSSNDLPTAHDEIPLHQSFKIFFDANLYSLGKYLS